MHCDICEIKNLIYGYADFLDRGDIDGLMSMFSGATLVALGPDGLESEVVGERAIRELYCSYTRFYEDDGTPKTLHLTSNVIVKAEKGADKASARSYAVVFQALDAFPLQPIIGVRYADLFARQSGGWRFERRSIETRLLGDLSHHLLQEI